MTVHNTTPNAAQKLTLLGRALRPFSFLKHEAAGGIVLMAAAALALIVANSPASDLYDQLFKVRISLGIAPVALEKSLLHWVNDGLMAVFFFLVGLEIKRELLVGALSSRKTAALPAIGAVGGMAIPALIYCIFNWHDAAALHGWAIPAATDIAFAVGVIALLGSRVPPSLKIFILALAIIDDLGAIIIIALFYSHDLSLVALALAAGGTVSLLVLNRLGVKAIWPFLAVGLFVWLCVLKSGIHATLAGVITALAIPLAPGQEGRAGPLERIEHALAPWVSFGILPMFALANAGVSLAGVGLAQLTQSIPLGIALGLFVGKAFGIFGVSWAAIRLGAADMPESASYGQLFGVSMLGGIGFTMSLFIGMLAFPDPDYATQIKIGVLTGSIASAALGYLLLRSLGARRDLPASG